MAFQVELNRLNNESAHGKISFEQIRRGTVVNLMNILEENISNKGNSEDKDPNTQIRNLLGEQKKRLAGLEEG